MRSKSATSSAGSKGKGKGKKIQSPVHEKKPGHPDDIFPVVLTSATQKLFGCRSDVDVTGESPYKLLKKDDIINDFKTRAAVSDFSPAKQMVLDYPDDELLLVFDTDFIYGQSFYLVLTPEAKERILNVAGSPEPETPEVFEDEVIKTPEPKPWICLGSEQEMEEESVRETGENLHFTYKLSEARRKFGPPAVFSDSKTTVTGCPSCPDSRFSIRPMERDFGAQAVPRLKSSSTQTKRKLTSTVPTQYTPRELSDEEKEEILRSERVQIFFQKVTSSMLKALQQETIMNVFVDQWKALGAASEDEHRSPEFPKHLLLFKVFSDQNYAKGKKISTLNWHPTFHGVIAVALTQKRTEDSPMFDSEDSFIVFYSFSDSSHAQLLLECPGDIFAFEFCPSDPNIIVGGCRNGQVVLWDMSAHSMHLKGTQPGEKVPFNNDTLDIDEHKEKKTPVVRYCAASPIENSHKAPITDVQWLPPTFEVTNTGLPVENKYNISTQIVSCSPDCSIKFWDVRVSNPSRDQKTHHTFLDTFKHLDTWRPFYTVSLPMIGTTGEYAPLKFCLEPYICVANNTAGAAEADNENAEDSEVVPDYRQLRVPSAEGLAPLEDVNTKLFIGTESGEIIYSDWKQVNDDSGMLQSAMPLACFSTHYWLVNTVQRSPFFKDIILTTGNWNFAIWKEGVTDGPIIVSPNSEQWCTVGCWSRTRPAILFIGKEDGSIEVWNLLEKMTEPVRIYPQVTNARISCIRPWTSSKQNFLAVTDELGMLLVFEMPKTLCVPSRNESSALEEYFAVEEDRLKDRLRRKEQRAKEPKRTDCEKPLKPPVDEEQEYKDYLKLEEQILKGLGLASATATHNTPESHTHTHTHTNL
ncbi:dynein axonemal intermediate chain 3 [Pungitius pungitius]|uniref:dynein axonemal intermediate chain 3 n=1 Tax=Pungitius pungitius TaxID=134920 RepID=UPI002E152C93